MQMVLPAFMYFLGLGKIYASALKALFDVERCLIFFSCFLCNLCCCCFSILLFSKLLHISYVLWYFRQALQDHEHYCVGLSIDE